MLNCRPSQCLHMVKDGEDDTKEHLTYAKDDCHLHLVGVGKDKLIVSNTPDLKDKGV